MSGIHCTRGLLAVKSAGLTVCLRHPHLAGIALSAKKRNRFSSHLSWPIQQFYPPGATADRGSIEKFARLVRAALREKSLVNIEARGKFALQRSLYALAGDGYTNFQTTWSEGRFHSMPDDITQRRPYVRLMAWRDVSEHDPAADDDNDDVDSSKFIHVNHGSQLVPLAKQLSLDIGRYDEAVAYVNATGIVAASTLLTAIASVPDFGQSSRITCSAYNISSRAEIKVICRETSDLRDADFKAFPPGKICDESTLRRFRNAVNDRLQSGQQAVVMDCRGKESIQHALLALARVQKFTAELEVHWTEFAIAGTNSEQRCLRIRALQGTSWEIFNAHLFKGGGLLKVTDSTKVKHLAQAVRAELQRNSFVSMHVPAENPVALAVALKALATAPLGPGGRRFICIPSMGKAKFQPSAEMVTAKVQTVPVLRLYTQRLGKAEA